MRKSLSFHAIRGATGLALVVGFLACGTENESPPAPSEVAPVEAAAPEPAVVPAPTTETVVAARPDGAGVVRVEVGDTIRFSVTRIEVEAGEKFRIELVHTGKMPKMAMGHNLVILKPGADVTAFGMAAAQARDTDFIPASGSDEILAHTALIGGGESSSIELVAPAAGTYEFVCSFPGHFAVMRGQLVVTEAGSRGAA